jgi:hypothetical protein
MLGVAAGGWSCATGGGANTSDIVHEIPWDGDESAQYVLQDNNANLIGEATLSIEREGDTYILRREFSDDAGNRDESEVVVNDDDLKPRDGFRDITDEDSRRVADFEYITDEDGEQIVQITQTIFDPPDDAEPESTRSNPMRVPEHAYDTHASLFVWRTIRFERGFKATYVEVFSNRRDTTEISVDVIREERVETPAGEFEAWLVFVSDGSTTQQAWISAGEDRDLLVYQFSDQVLLFAGKD